MPTPASTSPPPTPPGAAGWSTGARRASDVSAGPARSTSTRRPPPCASRGPGPGRGPGPLGDLTAAAGAAGRHGPPGRRGPRAGVVAGQRCAEEAFAQVDPALAVPGAAPTARPSAPGDAVAEVSGPAALDPHRRAHRPQLPGPPLGGGHPHPPLRRRRPPRPTRRSASSTPARPPRACGPWRRRRCGPAAATTTGPASPTPCWSRTTTWPGWPSPRRWPGPGTAGPGGWSRWSATARPGRRGLPGRGHGRAARQHDPRRGGGRAPAWPAAVGPGRAGRGLGRDRPWTPWRPTLPPAST